MLICGEVALELMDRYNLNSDYDSDLPPPRTISITYTIISSSSHLSFGVLMKIIVIIPGFVTSKR